MKELKEVRFNETNVELLDNLVKGSLLPEKTSELDRHVTIQGNTVIEGAVYAKKLEIRNGDSEIRGAVFAHHELYVNSEAKGNIIFRKSVGSANSLVSRAQDCNLIFQSDINAKSVSLYNAFVAGSIYADDIILQNCVVLGGVFATQNIDITHSIVGTFNSPSVRAAQEVWLLLPSAFSIEKINYIPGTKFYNLSLADLGALYKGLPQSPISGKIEMNLEVDEVKTSLTSDEVQKTLRSYTVIGKVLAADLLDTDKFQNHFLLTAASLGAQLLKTYDLGMDGNGSPVPLTTEKIKEFFFSILHGITEVQTISGKFDISDITGRFN
jgi:subtilisin family serine protease